MTTVRVTPDQVAAAKLQLALDAASGRTSSPLIARIASLTAPGADSSAVNQLPLSVKVRLGDGAVVEGAVTEEQLAALASSALAREAEGRSLNILQDAEKKALNIVRNASERWEAAQRDAETIHEVTEQLQIEAARNRTEAIQLRLVAARERDQAKVALEEAQHAAAQRRQLATQAEELLTKELQIAAQDTEKARALLVQAGEGSTASEQTFSETTAEVRIAINEVLRAFDRLSSVVQSMHRDVGDSEKPKTEKAKGAGLKIHPTATEAAETASGDNPAPS